MHESRTILKIVKLPNVSNLVDVIGTTNQAKGLADVVIDEILMNRCGENDRFRVDMTTVGVNWKRDALLFFFKKMDDPNLHIHSLKFDATEMMALLLPSVKRFEMKLSRRQTVTALSPTASDQEADVIEAQEHYLADEPLFDNSNEEDAESEEEEHS